MKRAKKRMRTRSRIAEFLDQIRNHLLSHTRVIRMWLEYDGVRYPLKFDLIRSRGVNKKKRKVGM